MRKVTIVNEVELPENYLIGHPEGLSKYEKLINEIGCEKLDPVQRGLIKEIKGILKDLNYDHEVRVFFTDYGKIRLVTPYSIGQYYNLLDVKEQAQRDLNSYYDEMSGDCCEDDKDDDNEGIEYLPTGYLQTGVIGWFWKGVSKDGTHHEFSATFDNYDRGGGESIFGSDVSASCRMGYTPDSLKDFEEKISKMFIEQTGKRIRLLQNGRGYGVVWLGDL